MLAVVEVDAGQEAKRGKATDEEGQRTPPPPPLPVATARPHRQPTPDHPPYCWMIGEAIDELAEDGGSAEDSISAFIRARHPGVPPAHDRLLRHYLGKHVAEGFFVRTAAGRYERCPEENADEEELPVVQASLAGSCKPGSVEAKRGRGRPRKGGGSPSTPPSDGRAGAQAQWMTPPAGSSLMLAVAAKESVPVSPVAVADKDDSQASSLKRKRRRRLRKLGMAMTTDSSGEAIVHGKKDGSEVPYTLDKEKEHEPPRELALVILGDSSATPTMEKACTTEVPPTKPPVDGGQPLDLAVATTPEVHVPPQLVPTPTLAMDNDGGSASSILDKNDSIRTTPTVPEPGSRACKFTLMAAAAGAFVPVLVANNKGDLPSTYKDVLQHRKAGSCPTAGKKARRQERKCLSATSKGRGRQRKSAALAPGEMVVGRKISFASPKLTPVIAGVCSTPASVADQGRMEASTVQKQHGQARKLYPVTADEISDDPGLVLLALPSRTLASSNA